MINLDWLQSFAAFSVHANFTRAAAELGLSQPALHVQIRNLSEDLGVRLYRRVGRRLELTPRGIEVARFAREMMTRVAAFRATVAGRDPAQPVVLAAGAGAYRYLLGPAIEAFARAGRAPLRLVTVDGAGAVAAVRDGTAQLGVAALATVPDGIAARSIATVGQVLVVPADHPLAGTRAPLSALADLALVVPPRDRPHRRGLESALRAAGVSLRVAVEATGWELVLHFVKLGLGLAVVNAFCALPEGFVAVELPELPSHEYFVFHTASAELPPETRLLADMIAGTDESYEQRR